MQRLCEDHAIESLCRKRVRFAQIGHDRRLDVRRVDIEDIPAAHSTPTKAVRVLRIQHFEACSFYIIGMHREERLDIDPVDGRSAIVTPNGG